MKPTPFFIICFAFITTTSGATDCDCVNPVFIDNPKYIQECYPQAKFVNQVYQNFNFLYNQLLFQGIPRRCNFEEYRNFAKGMEARTLRIIDAFFSCTEDDCTSIITEAHKRYLDFFFKSFEPYLICSLTNYSPECVTVIMQIQSPAIESGENILTSLLTCEKLKSGKRVNNQQINFLQAIAPIPTQFGGPPCNCLKVDDLPIPRSENECYSREYIATLKNFIEVNYGRTCSAYNSNKSPQCDYSELQTYLEKFKVISLKVANLLEKKNPTFVVLDQLTQERKALARSYILAQRQYVLGNDKSCSDVARTVRPNTIRPPSEVTLVLSKCIAYRDKC